MPKTFIISAAMVSVALAACSAEEASTTDRHSTPKNAAVENTVVPEDAYPIASDDQRREALLIRRLESGDKNDAETVPRYTIAETLPDKTLLIEIIEEKPNYEEGYIDRFRRSRFMYFKKDGTFFLAWGGRFLEQGQWATIDDKYLYIRYETKDPDGATRIVVRVPALAEFFENIFDSADGDYCQLERGTTEAFSLEEGKFPESIAAACRNRKI